jgi:hypothetical protein
MHTRNCSVRDGSKSILGAQLLHTSSTGSLVVFGAPAVSPGQETLWYLVYCLVLLVAVSLVVRRCGAGPQAQPTSSAPAARCPTSPVKAGASGL